MTTIFNMLCLATIVACIVNISDFPYTVKKVISYIVTKGKIVKDDYRLHLVDCDWCIASWTNLIYLFVVGQFTIPYIAAVFIISTFTPVITELILTIKDIILKLTQIINENLNK